MSLHRIFQELYALAAARETPEQRGEAFKHLGRGAEITVRAHGRRRQVVLARAGVEVGEIEEQTFRRDGAIPDTAERRAYASISGWYYVAFTWEVPAPAPTLFDLPLAPPAAEPEPYRLPEVADLPDHL